MKLDHLTAEQEARLPKIADEWIEKGLATGPVDRKAVEASMAEAYKAGGLEPPKRIIWEPSPFAGAIRAAILMGALSEEIGGDDRDKVQAGISGQLDNACFGQHDVSWLAFFAAFHEFGVEGLETLKGLWGMAECGWWWPFDEAVVLTERPVFLKMDEEGRLHHESRYAIEYADGWGVPVWHGVRPTTSTILDPASITLEEILAEEEESARQVTVNRATWEVKLSYQLMTFGGRR